LERKVTENIQWRLIARPTGAVGREHFDVTHGAVPVPGPGEVLVRNIYLFIPPSMRLWMNEKDSYVPAQPLGQVMMGGTLGVVEASNAPALPVGSFVNGMGGCQQWFVAPAEHLLPLRPHPDVPLAAYRGALDVQGLTAYCGVTEVCQPKAGETMVVTAAAGSVGSAACQIGKKLGLKVIGIAGGREKCDWLVKECGIDGAIDYKADDVGARLDALCPEGVDILFENVGGPVMDLVLDRIRERARIALCGLIASYNGGGTQRSESLMQVVIKKARIQGFLVSDYFARIYEVTGILQDWVLDGSYKYQMDILEGFDSIVPAMERVFSGRNHGVQIVKLSEEPAR
jgi:hypothetical protein